MRSQRSGFLRSRNSAKPHMIAHPQNAHSQVPREREENITVHFSPIKMGTRNIRPCSQLGSPTLRNKREDVDTERRLKGGAKESERLKRCDRGRETEYAGITAGENRFFMQRGMEEE